MQVLIDFVTKCTIPEKEHEGEDPMLEDPKNQSMMFMDEASNANGSKVGLVLIGLEGWDIQYTLWFRFCSINNEAEYKAMITELTIAKE